MLLVVTTEPVIRDLPSDVMEQAKVHASYRSQFGFHQRDLERLLGVLFRWQQSQPPAPGQTEHPHIPSSSRRVVLLNGDQFQSFDSVIQQFKSSAPVVPAQGAVSSECTSVQAIQRSRDDASSIRQFVVGLLCAPSPEVSAGYSGNEMFPRPLLFLEGAFFGQYAYRHFRVVRQVSACNNIDNAPAQPSMESSELVDNNSLVEKSASELAGQPPQCQFLRISLSLTGPNHSGNLATAADSGGNNRWCSCQYISRDPVEPRIQVDQKSQENDQDALVCVTYLSIHARASSDDTTEPNLKMKLPTWLLEVRTAVPYAFSVNNLTRVMCSGVHQLMLQPLTSEEQTQMDERAELLRDKTAAITTTFEQSSELVDGLLGFWLDSRGCIAELTHLFAEFYNRLGGAAVCEKFLASPSSLAVRLVLYQLLKNPADAFPISGAIDVLLFERLLTRCFLDGWMLSSRLTQLFVGTKDITASNRQEARANSTGNRQAKS